MGSGKFLINSLKEKFDFGGEDDEPKGFPDLNYVVGNTSGMPVGNIPVPLDRRVGDQAQIGGGVMEVQVYNPASFAIERPELINSIEQLGLDITLHSDPNSGFASAYKTRGQQGVGVETVHRYFSNYLEQLAAFKKEVETREDTSFHIGRINPHISTSGLPSIEERMPMDVGLDPFGYQMNEMQKQIDDERSSKSKNMWENEEFLKRFYRTFLLDQLDFEYQYFNVFSQFSSPFKEEWDNARSAAANHFFQNEAEREAEGSQKKRINAKLGAITTARQQDSGVDISWRKIAEEKSLSEPVPQFALQPSGEDEEPRISREEIGDLGELLPLERGVTGLSNFVYELNKRGADFFVQSLSDMPMDVMELIRQEKPEIYDEIMGNYEYWIDIIQTALEEALDDLWNGNGVDNISVDAKITGLARHFDLQQNRIDERAFKEFEDTLKEKSEELIMGEEDLFSEEDKNQLNRHPHKELLRRLMQNFEQQMWMETHTFYRILPCWMATSDESNDNHEGWEAPKFIWNTLVERRWSEEYDGDYDLDLTDPNKEDGYFDALQNEREFQMDVAAASAACYVWGHFTQMEMDMEIKDEEYFDDIEEEETTWMEWMNKFGIGVNLEAMAGSPQQLVKIWRPKDIVAAARAINMTASKEIDDFHEQLDEAIAKFTIDMEHVASFGANPWTEMELLIEQEKWLAEESSFELDADDDKPLSRMLRQYHLMRPGVEDNQGTRHGPYHRGDKTLYTWIYKLVEAGFARNPGEAAALMYEQGEEKAETIYMAKLTMNMIELGIEPDEVDPAAVSPGEDYSSPEEALIARFFNMDKSSYSREWTKIEEHAFDPLTGLLEAEQFDHTWSGRAAIENDKLREWGDEEYQ